jgi:hypothetical protein
MYLKKHGDKSEGMREALEWMGEPFKRLKYRE